MVKCLKELFFNCLSTKHCCKIQFPTRSCDALLFIRLKIFRDFFTKKKFKYLKKGKSEIFFLDFSVKPLTNQIRVHRRLLAQLKALLIMQNSHSRRGQSLAAGCVGAKLPKAVGEFPA